MLQEIKMLRQVGTHPNVNQLINFTQAGQRCFIFLDMCTGGTLQDLVAKARGLAEHQAAMYILKLLKTTQFIHGKGLSG